MNLPEIQVRLREAGLDAWLFFDHHERDPLAYRILGFSPDQGVTRRWYYLVPAEGSPRKLVHRIESRMLDAVPGSRTLYSGWRELSLQLGSLLQGCRRVAMQFSPGCAIPYISLVDAGTVDGVRSLGVEVVSSADLVQLFEARWSASQLAGHLEAGRRVDRIRQAAFDHAQDALRHHRDLSEWDLRCFIREKFDAEGLECDHGPIVAVDAHASDPHYEPSAVGSSAIQRNSLLLLDMWAKLREPGSVYYDITWTAFCGAVAPERMQQVFEVVATARNRAVTRVQTGVASGAPLCGFEVDDAAREHIAAAGYGEFFVHRTGHSIGTEVHGSGANMDNLETHDERRILSNTCFSVEPGIYLPEFGIRSEVNVFVSDSEAYVTGEQQQALLTF